MSVQTPRRLDCFHSRYMRMTLAVCCCCDCAYYCGVDKVWLLHMGVAEALLCNEAWPGFRFFPGMHKGALITPYAGKWSVKPTMPTFMLQGMDAFVPERRERDVGWSALLGRDTITLQARF